MIHYANGCPAKPSDLDLIARAFGFTSAHHLNQVMAGEAPSGMESQRAFQNGRNYERAEHMRRQTQSALAEIDRAAS